MICGKSPKTPAPPQTKNKKKKRKKHYASSNGHAHEHKAHLHLAYVLYKKNTWSMLKIFGQEFGHTDLSLIPERLQDDCYTIAVLILEDRGVSALQVDNDSATTHLILNTVKCHIDTHTRLQASPTFLCFKSKIITCSSDLYLDEFS